MTILETIISSINERIGTQISFKEFEDKKYFVVNDIMTNVFLNKDLLRSVEELNSYSNHEGVQSLICSVSEIYSDSIIQFLEKNSNVRN